MYGRAEPGERSSRSSRPAPWRASTCRRNLQARQRVEYAGTVGMQCQQALRAEIQANRINARPDARQTCLAACQEHERQQYGQRFDSDGQSDQPTGQLCSPPSKSRESGQGEDEGNDVELLPPHRGEDRPEGRESESDDPEPKRRQHVPQASDDDADRTDDQNDVEACQQTAGGRDAPESGRAGHCGGEYWCARPREPRLGMPGGPRNLASNVGQAEVIRVWIGKCSPRPDADDENDRTVDEKNVVIPLLPLGRWRARRLRGGHCS